MIVNLVRRERMYFISLPDKVKGQFWITDRDGAGLSRNLISIEAVDNDWMIKSNRTAWLVDSDGNRMEFASLEPLVFFCINIQGLDEKVSIFAEPATDDRQKLSKVMVSEACDVSIGRDASHDICFPSPFVSESNGRGHARLRFDGEIWTILDNESTNGTYVNGLRVSSRKLVPGDLVYIVGLRIVVGHRFLAINNPNQAIQLSSRFFRDFQPQPVERTEDLPDMGRPDYFYRSPRFMRELVKAEIAIDPPPAPQRAEQVPLALMLGPAMTMGVASLSTGIFTVINVTSGSGNIMQALPILLMSVSMLIGTILWPILTKRHERKQNAANEKKRQEKYLSYLEAVRDEIKRKCKDQSDILTENLVSTEECIAVVSGAKRNLWERIPGQADFARLRLGTGTLPLFAEISYQEKKFTIEYDNLQDALYSLADEPKELRNVPVSISLTDNFVSGIVGPRDAVLGIVRSLVIQAASLHSYDELKMVFIIDAEELPLWEFAKWLPHAWNNERSTRYIASGPDEVKEMSAILEASILSTRQDNDRSEYMDFAPYYLIFSASKELALKCESLNRLLAYKNNAGFSIVALYDDIKNLPKETTSVIDVNARESRIFDKDDTTGKEQTFFPESIPFAVANRVAVAIANVPLDLSAQQFALPNVLTFLEMFGVSKVEHLNPLTRWQENNPSLSLQTPVGVDIYGEPFLLDLHENVHGPHGLVAGTTGSGKSEFLRTFILSLAVNYHPDEVAFLLIDYKGNDLAGAFVNDSIGIRLPHIAGVISNLDGAAIKRSMVSITSEAMRRQALFGSAKSISGEGTMDIYRYQRLYREKIVKEPLPHLFIIADEFAELKDQQPDFMDMLIQTARIGRSLGIHLILATQKPTGVVNAQIWSNSKFRVCLKVQEKSDSMEMINVPDAAELTQTGRFYLQVGFNEMLALGQSAWSGSDYYPAETIEKKIDSTIQVVDNLGRTIKEAKPAQQVKKTAAGQQLVSVVRYLSDLAREEKLAVRQLWHREIPALIYVDDIEKKYAHRTERAVLNPVVGEYDDPYNQRQGALTLPLSAEGNCILYGSTGNGKTTYLTTLIYSLIKNHDAEELNVYALDLAAETLRVFESAPQVGNILLSGDEEKIHNLFKLLLQEMNSRKQAFSMYGGDYASYIKNSGKAVPNILVVINNYPAFSEQFEALDAAFALLTRDGLKYGIYFVITSSNTMAIRYRIQQNFKQILTMQMNDESNYSVILGRTGGVVPSAHKGRGLVNLERIYEFQTAHFALCADPFEYLGSFCKELREHAVTTAAPVAVMPSMVDAAYFPKNSISLSAFPIGVSKQSLQAVEVNLEARAILPAVARDSDPLLSFVQALSETAFIGELSPIVIDAERLFTLNGKPGYAYVSSDFEQILETLSNLQTERASMYGNARNDGTTLPEFTEMLIIIFGIRKLMSLLSPESAGVLKGILEKAEPAYRMPFLLADTADHMRDRSLSLESWYKKQVTGLDGIWVGNGYDSQMVFPMSRMTADMREDLGDDFGFLVSRGKPALLRLLSQ